MVGNAHFGPGSGGEALELLSPFAIWAAGWLWSWEGDYDILEPRLIPGLLADAAGLFLSVLCALNWYLDHWSGP